MCRNQQTPLENAINNIMCKNTHVQEMIQEISHIQQEYRCKRAITELGILFEYEHEDEDEQYMKEHFTQVRMQTSGCLKEINDHYKKEIQALAASK